MRKRASRQEIDSSKEKEGIQNVSPSGSEMSNAKTFSLVSCLVVLTVTLVICFPYLNGEMHTLPTISKNASSQRDSQIASFTKYENCTISFSPEPEKPNWTTKPFWFPSYPDSMDDDLVKKIITGITGLSAGAKSYYAQSKKLKKCKGQTETALCMLIHPIVETTPEKFASDFQEKVIIGMRNPMTAIPTHFNGKAIKYHNQKGQVSQDDWRNFRDQYMKGMLEEWKKQIRTWKSMNPYHVGTYISLEQMMDSKEGPAALQRLAKDLRSAGFQVANDDDIPCIWYTGVRKETLEAYEKHKYEYTDYYPGYTKDQQNLLIEELDKFVDENKDDAGLVAILKEYQAYIRDHSVLEDGQSLDSTTKS